MEALIGKSQVEIIDIVRQLQLPSYTAGQIAHWLYKKCVTDIEQMSNISKQNRELLKKNFEIGCHAPVKESISGDATKKYLFKAGESKYIESAYIPDRQRHTLCVSSQVGCKMGCIFCATGKQGLQGQLNCGEIINQVYSLPERELLTNLVYMGMGEPFDNLAQVMKSLEIMTAEWGFGWSPRRITVSTIGILPAMKHFIEKSSCHLAISLHSPFEEERARLMPVQSRYSLKEAVTLIRGYDFGRQRRISFEYIVFKGLNDSVRHVNELARLLNGMRCRINLIRFHKIEGVNLDSPDTNQMEKLMLMLNQKGIRTTIRASRGQDIEAACGLLSTRYLKKQS